MHWPQECKGCAAGLGLEAQSERVHHQWELPKIKPHIIEHRYPRVRCARCGRLNAAEPSGGERKVFGPGLVATSGWLQGRFGLSRTDTQALLSELFGITMSSGTLSQKRKEVGCGLVEPVREAEGAIQKALISGMDETSYRCRGGLGWLWVRTSELLTVFRLERRRNRKAAHRLMDALEQGQVVVTDRYGVYLHLEPSQHQLCWAHLHREFIALSEHAKRAARFLGQRLCEDTEQVFAVVYRIRDGTLTAQTGHEQLRCIRKRMASRLRLGWRLSEAKARGKMKHIERYFERYWTFMAHEDVPLTNNDSERALRHAVIWRKTSFGVQSSYGALFVETMLSVLHSLRSQGRETLEFVTRALVAHQHGRAAPSLLPCIGC